MSSIKDEAQRETAAAVERVAAIQSELESTQARQLRWIRGGDVAGLVVLAAICAAVATVVIDAKWARSALYAIALLQILVAGRLAMGLARWERHASVFAVALTVIAIVVAVATK